MIPTPQSAADAVLQLPVGGPELLIVLVILAMLAVAALLAVGLVVGVVMLLRD